MRKVTQRRTLHVRLMGFYKTFFRVELSFFLRVQRSYFRQIARFLYKRKILIKTLQIAL